MSIAMRFRVEPAAEGGDRWEVRTFAYSYLLFRDDREIVAYHWDHEVANPGAVRTPHVHFGKDLPHPGLPAEDREQIGSLAAAHMPTGVIPFTSILRTAIRDLGVEPPRHQGEGLGDARVGADRSFAEAEAALAASFSWWRDHEFAAR